MGPPDSDGVSRVPPYSGYPLGSSGFKTWGFHPLWPAFPGRRPSRPSLNEGPSTPGGEPPGLGSSVFARHYWRNRCHLSLPPGTEMFHFPGFAPQDYGFILRSHRAAVRGFPIRTLPDQRLPAAPRNFSQLAASFVACRCLGIRHAPLATWPQIFPRRPAKAAGRSKVPTFRPYLWTKTPSGALFSQFSLLSHTSSSWLVKEREPFSGSEECHATAVTVLRPEAESP